MINLTYISFGALTLLLILLLSLGGIDYRKKRELTKKPHVSFLIPCFNDGSTVENTIKSIYRSYDRDLFELIVVDDKSTDNSLSILRKLNKKYGFRLLENKENLGKAKTLNSVSKRAKHDILFIVDADVILNRKALYDVFARLQEKEVKAVSCPYNARNTGLLAVMQELEYNMLSLLQGAYNIKSTLSLWGGCLAVKKKAFEQVKRFSLNAIVEDMDLALKLNEAGYKVRQSFVPIKTYVPETAKSWYKQKIRWTSGGAQCLIRYIKIWLKSPLHIIFILLFTVLSVLYVISVMKEAFFIDNIIETFHLITEGATRLKNFELTGFYYGAILLKNLLSNLYFSVFSTPYVFPMIKKANQVLKVLYLIPFSLVYYPAFTVVSVIGFVTGVVRYRSLREGRRAW